MKRQLFPWAAILVLSHLVTAIIQRRPMLYQEQIQTLVNLTFGSETSFIAALSGILLLLAWNNFGKAGHRREISTKFAMLSDGLGKIPVMGLFLSMMLPQRIIDLNTGYTPIEAGSSVAWFLLFLDILRGFGAFQIFLWLLDAPQSLPGAAQSNPKKSPCTAIIFCLCMSLIFSLTTQIGVLENIPHVQDEIIQDWHARIFATGQNHAPPVPCRESFLVWGIGDAGDRLYSSFQPGYPLLLSLGMKIFQALPFLPPATCLLNPLLFLMSCLVLHSLLRNTHNLPTAHGAVSLLAISPFSLIMISGRMNHPASLLLFIACAWGIALLDDRRFVKAAIIIGLSCGYMLMTRRLDGAILAVTTLATIVTTNRRDPGLLFSTILAALSITLVFGIQSRLNLAHSGDAMQMIRQAERVSGSWSQIPLGTYVQNFVDQVLGFNVYAFGGILTGFMGMGFLSWKKPGSAGWLERFFSIHAFFTIVGYGLYDYQDFCYGPRFYFNLLPGACLGNALLLSHLSTFVSTPRIRRWIVIGACFALLFACHHLWAVFGHHYWHIDREFEQVLRQNIQHPSLVFLQSSTRTRLGAAKLLIQKGVHAEHVEEIISTDALDFLGLEEALKDIPPASDTHSLISPIVNRFVLQARFSSPIEHEINEHELVRLNSPAIFDQPMIIALDLGDAPNKALMDKLPRHTPLLAFRKGKRYLLKPYSPCGIASFR